MNKKPACNCQPMTAILLLAVFSVIVSACTIIGSPATPEPTATTTPLPPSPTPTLTPTPSALSVPQASADYPQTLPERAVTAATFEQQKADFATLTTANTNIAADAEVLRAAIEQIAQLTGITVDIIGVVDQDRWGLIVKDASTGEVMIPQKVAADNTWQNLADISPFSEYTSAAFDAALYRYIPLPRLKSLPDNAISVVFANQGWLQAGFADPDNGEALVLLNAVENTYVSRDGQVVPVVRYQYKPFSEITSPQECIDQTIPPPTDPSFAEAWQAYRDAVRPVTSPESHDYMGRVVMAFEYPNTDAGFAPYSYKYGWNFSYINSGVLYKPYGDMLGCASMPFPDGKSLMLFTFPIRLFDTSDTYVYVMMTVAVDQELLINNYFPPEGSFDIVKKQPFAAQFPDMKQWLAIYSTILTPSGPITEEMLNDPVAGRIAAIMRYNEQNIPDFRGLFYRAFDANTGINPDEAISFEKAIFTGRECLASGCCRQ